MQASKSRAIAGGRRIEAGVPHFRENDERGLEGEDRTFAILGVEGLQPGTGIVLVDSSLHKKDRVRAALLLDSIQMTCDHVAGLVPGGEKKE